MPGEHDPLRQSDELARPTSTHLDAGDSDSADGEKPLPPFFAGDEDAPTERATEEAGADTTPAAPEPAPEPATERATEEAAEEAFPFEDQATEPAPAPENGDEDDFPVEAFDVPELRGEERPAAAPAPTALSGASAAEVADRLDALASKLRAEGAAALSSQVEMGDRFDALLAGMVAGYLAARDG